MKLITGALYRLKSSNTSVKLVEIGIGEAVKVTYPSGCSSWVRSSNLKEY